MEAVARWHQHPKVRWADGTPAASGRDPLCGPHPLGFWFVRIVDGVDLNDPVEAAEGRAAFELKPIG